MLYSIHAVQKEHDVDLQTSANMTPMQLQRQNRICEICLNNYNSRNIGKEIKSIIIRPSCKLVLQQHIGL